MSEETNNEQCEGCKLEIATAHVYQCVTHTKPDDEDSTAARIQQNEVNLIGGLIATIKPNKPNFDYCSENHIINGSLHLDIERVMRQYSNHQNKEQNKEINHLKYALSKAIEYMPPGNANIIRQQLLNKQ